VPSGRRGGAHHKWIPMCLLDMLLGIVQSWTCEMKWSLCLQWFSFISILKKISGWKRECVYAYLYAHVSKLLSKRLKILHFKAIASICVSGAPGTWGHWWESWGSWPMLGHKRSRRSLVGDWAHESSYSQPCRWRPQSSRIELEGG